MVLKPELERLVTSHPDLADMEAELAEATSLVDAFNARKVELERQAAEELIAADLELRAAGLRGRGPISATPAMKELAALTERKAAAQQRGAILPTVISRLRTALAAAAAKIPRALELEKKYNELAAEALSLLAQTVKTADQAREVGRQIENETAELRRWFAVSPDLSPLLPTSLHGLFAEQSRLAKLRRDRLDAEGRRARGEVTERESLDSEFTNRGAWQKTLAIASKEYRLTRDGKKTWQRYKDALSMLNGFNEAPHGDPSRDECLKAAQERLDQFHTAACAFSKLKVEPEWMPQLNS